MDRHKPGPASTNGVSSERHRDPFRKVIRIQYAFFRRFERICQDRGGCCWLREHASVPPRPSLAGNTSVPLSVQSQQSKSMLFHQCLALQPHRNTHIQPWYYSLYAPYLFLSCGGLKV